MTQKHESRFRAKGPGYTYKNKTCAHSRENRHVESYVTGEGANERRFKVCTCGVCNTVVSGPEVVR